jgi:SAM-dependent methyltransferase
MTTDSAGGAPAQCPLCGGGSVFAFAAGDRNHRTTHESFAYYRCRQCSTVFLASPPDDLGLYYTNDYHPFDREGQPRWRHDSGLLAAEAWRVGTLQDLVSPGTLIDVGAGAGGFAAAAHSAGFDVTAIEMDRECCEFMEAKLGVRAIATNQPIAALRAQPPARVVAFWHVLEHLPQPAEALSAAADALEPGGVLAIAVPNPDSIQFRLLRTRWAHLDAPRHVCLMPVAALVEHARSLGLELLLRTTSDPSGVACTVHGWVSALRSDPAGGPPRYPAIRLGTALAAVLAPAESRGRGAAVTLFLRKLPAQARSDESNPST